MVFLATTICAAGNAMHGGIRTTLVDKPVRVLNFLEFVQATTENKLLTEGMSQLFFWESSACNDHCMVIVLIAK